MSFKDIPYQERAKRILQGAIKNNRIPNAYLFVGPGNTGKSKVAQTLAMALNCEQGRADSCGRCSPCRKIKDGIYPDVIALIPKGMNIKIGEIRELRTLVRYGPSLGRWLVAIIHEAEKFTIEAANSFLKVLEEPPPSVLFILISSRENAIPLTVVSRCQRIIFTEREKYEKKEIDSDEISWLYREFDSIKDKNIIELLGFSSELADRRDALEDLLDIVLFKYWDRLKDERESRDAIKIILDTQKRVRDRANLRLSLDLMCLKLKEVFSGQKTCNKA